jgi:Zn-finger nucleic acid-binding protein
MSDSGADVNPEGRQFWLDRRELDVLCESLWHSLARADVPDEDIDVMRELRERLNDARR